MAPRRSKLMQRLDEIAGRMEGEARDAFMASVRSIKDQASLSRLVEALEAGDIAAAVRAIGIDERAYAPLVEALERAYSQSGAAAALTATSASKAVGSGVVFRFNVRSPDAERFLRDLSSRLIVEVTEDQRQAVRVALERRMIEGVNPRTAALEVAGRMNRATGRREGGIVGLSMVQEGYVARAAEELASGDTKALRNYLQRERRDKRFDPIVIRAIEAGEPIPRATAQKLASRYSDRLLALRGETIARTEMLQALNVAQQEAFAQIANEGDVRPDAVMKVWRTAADARVRDTHGALGGSEVGKDERFGNGLMYPHEPGAPASEVVNCRCIVEHRVDWLKSLEPKAPKAPRAPKVPKAQPVRMEMRTDFERQYVPELDATGPEVYRRAFNATPAPASIFAPPNRGAHYQPARHEIVMPRERPQYDRRPLHTTFAHEMGHAVDMHGIVGEKNVRSARLAAAIKKDRKAMRSGKDAPHAVMTDDVRKAGAEALGLADDDKDTLTKIESAFKARNPDDAMGLIENIRYERRGRLGLPHPGDTLEHTAMAMLSQLSDYVEAVTDGKRGGRYGGHGREYYRRFARLAPGVTVGHTAEAFAHVFSASVAKNHAFWRYALRAAAPNVFDAAEQIVKEVADGV